MNTSKQSLWARANTALRNRDFESAVALYEKAIIHAEEPLKSQIHFNLRLAKLRSVTSNTDNAKSLRIETPPPSRSQSDVDPDLQAVIRDITSHFDSEFYLAMYQDIDKAGIDPLVHYCTTGWIERCDPRSDFSTASYLEMNPDVAKAGINPFWHYIVAGKAEGREKAHPGGYKAEILRTLPSLEQMLAHWKQPVNQPKSLTADKVFQLIARQITKETSRLAISVGHDHYKKISGGVQLCIQREEQVAIEHGVLYLNVHPWQPMPLLASAADNPDPLICMVLSGRDSGICHSSVLTQALKQIAAKLHGAVHVIVHSFLGHAIEHVSDWVRLRQDRRCWLWLHDFFTLCPNYTLQRNSISYCGAPTINSNACAICIYGNERQSHLHRMNDFFKNVAATVVSPSEVTKRFWLSKIDHLMTEVKVLPHLDMQWADRERPALRNSKKPLSVGFLGGRVYHKGWHVFEKLTQVLEGDSRFQFVYLGNRKPSLSGVQFVNVHVTADDCFAMARSVSEAEIDFVIHWATWPETFSFTTHEAIAGGAYVLTNPVSGNVAAAVTRTGMGVVLPDEPALFDFFKSNDAEQMATTIRANKAKRVCKPRYSEMTIPFLLNEGTI
jgi:hypothetical protein